MHGKGKQMGTATVSQCLWAGARVACARTALHETLAGCHGATPLRTACEWLVPIDRSHTSLPAGCSPAAQDRCSKSFTLPPISCSVVFLFSFGFSRVFAKPPTSPRADGH
jgi:hypothetical protein